MTTIKHLITLFVFSVLLLGSSAFAQGVIQLDEYDLGKVAGYGGLETTYEAYDNAEMGALILRQSTPGDQEANFDVVGPNDYWEHFDFSDGSEEFVLDNLQPGIYSVAATDEGLELSHTVVEVRVGEAAVVNADLTAWEEGYEAGAYDPYLSYGTYAGYEDAYPGYPYAAYTVGPYAGYDDPDLGAIAISGVDEGVDVIVTGPNGYSESFEADTVIEGLAPGVYAVAASGEGTETSVTTVEVQSGQQLPLTPGMYLLE